MIGFSAIFKKNLREYGMYIALFAIIVYFTMATKGTFISPRNVSNLLNQTGYIAALAIGVTLVIIIRHIDLSIGYMSGFSGALIALMIKAGFSLWLILPIILMLGICFGLANGFFVAKIGVPAFVVTLGGMLVFRGLLLLTTNKTGTIIVENEVFNAIGNGYIPNFINMQIGQIKNFTTIVIGGVLTALYILNEIKNRSAKIKYNFEVLSNQLFVLKLLFISTIIACITYILSMYNGISWTVVIIGIFTGIYHFMMNKTTLGRHIYAVGGNPEAAELSGISVKKITMIVFASMGMLAVISGILYTSRLQSATTTAGEMFELDAIAGAYVGGVAASGGEGKIANTIIGALVMSSLINGMDLMGTDIAYQYIIKGAVLVSAVSFDITTRKKVQ